MEFIGCLNHSEVKGMAGEKNPVKSSVRNEERKETKMTINEATMKEATKSASRQQNQTGQQSAGLEQRNQTGQQSAGLEQQNQTGQQQADLEKQVRHQMRVIKKGAAELIGEEQLEEKIRRSILTGVPLNVKFGMDPSAPDLHLGHAVALRKLKQLQDLGHNIIIVIGDFTGKIGDPTGKSKGRRAMSDIEVLQNAQTYKEQVFHILDKEKTTVRYNGEWLELLGLGEMLGLASTVTVARMLEREDFKNRFANNVPIGIHEFFYPLLQAYDSIELKADLELGGTDQTFNILMGRNLQGKMGMEPQAALFLPILEGLDGVEKMSKSLGNYIGIYEDAKTMFQKVMQIPDGLIIKYFELATDIEPEELDRIKEVLADGANPKDSKLLLAQTITQLYHGREETEEAKRFFKEAFTDKGIPEKVEVLQVVLEQGNLYDCIHPLIQAGIVSSGAQLRRLIAQGGVKKNGETVCELTEKIQENDVLRVGKRQFVQLHLS